MQRDFTKVEDKGLKAHQKPRKFFYVSVILFLHIGLFYFLVHMESRKAAIHCTWIFIFSFQEMGPGKSRISCVLFRVPKREHLTAPAAVSSGVHLWSKLLWLRGRCVRGGVSQCRNSCQVPTGEGQLKRTL